MTRARARSTTTVALGLGLIALGLSACTVHSSSKDGQDNVHIATPFGGLHVNSNQTTATDLGLPAYPGATLVKERKNGHDDGAADIGLSFGSFHLKVQAVGYQTPDPADKVLDFYRPALAKFGQVIECNGGRPVGQPTVTDSGLTCNDNDHKSGHGGDTSIVGNDVHINGNHVGRNELQLRVGNPHTYRVVGIENSDEGQTKFTLLYLELPRGDKDKDSTN
jgi:hypothetical protein